MKEIYTQLFEDLPDIGAIEYLGSKSKSNGTNYLMNFELEKEKDNNTNYKKDMNLDSCKLSYDYKNISNDEKVNVNLNKGFKKKGRGEAQISQNYSEDVIRIYANIDDIKTIVNNGLYNTLIQTIVKNKCNNQITKTRLINITGKLSIYEGYNSQEDIFLRLDNYCIWIKKSLLKTDIQVLLNILDVVNVIGFIIKKNDIEKVVKNKASNGEELLKPIIIKAIAIYT